MGDASSSPESDIRAPDTSLSLALARGSHGDDDNANKKKMKKKRREVERQRPRKGSRGDANVAPVASPPATDDDAAFASFSVIRRESDRHLRDDDGVVESDSDNDNENNVNVNIISCGAQQHMPPPATYPLVPIAYPFPAPPPPPPPVGFALMMPLWAPNEHPTNATLPTALGFPLLSMPTPTQCRGQASASASASVSVQSGNSCSSVVSDEGSKNNDGNKSQSQSQGQSQPCYSEEVKVVAWVTTKGEKEVSGFVSDVDEKGKVSIVCLCHRQLFTPAEFVRHAGSADVSHPERRIFMHSQRPALAD